MKTQEELRQLKSEFETLNSKLKELTEEELQDVTGGKPLGFQVGIVNYIEKMGFNLYTNQKEENISDKKQNLTGSVISIKPEDISNRNEDDFMRRPAIIVPEGGIKSE